MTIALKLRRRLAQLGMTQRELARRARMSESQISKYLHNVHIPDRRWSQERLAEALEVPLRWFDE